VLSCPVIPGDVPRRWAQRRRAFGVGLTWGESGNESRPTRGNEGGWTLIEGERYKASTTTLPRCMSLQASVQHLPSPTLSHSTHLYNMATIPHDKPTAVAVEMVDDISPDTLIEARPGTVAAEAVAQGQLTTGYEDLGVWQTIKRFKIASAICFFAALSAATDGYQIS
jgi:hypothetical protein